MAEKKVSVLKEGAPFRWRQRAQPPRHFARFFFSRHRRRSIERTNDDLDLLKTSTLIPFSPPPRLASLLLPNNQQIQGFEPSRIKMARAAAAGSRGRGTLLLLACVAPLLLLLAASPFVAAVPNLDAFVGDDLGSRRPSSSSSHAAIAAAAQEKGQPLDDLTAFWLENAEELRARDERLSPGDRALELSRRETEWRNAAKRKEKAERMEKGEEDEEERKSLKEMERERKKFKEARGTNRDSAAEEGVSFDPESSSNVIDAATLYSPPKATAFRAQGDAPSRISLGKMLTEGKKGRERLEFLVLFFFLERERDREVFRGKINSLSFSLPLPLSSTSFPPLQATTPRQEAAAQPRERPAPRKTSPAWSSTPST
jgi:hypothetical protein